MDQRILPGIRETFRNRRVLVIGATGFLGKIIVEKLLREAPDIAQIILLVRSNRRGQSAARRVANEIIDTPLFHDLRDCVGAQQFAALTCRLAAVRGDVTRPGLGLDSALYRQLADSVDVVVNSAASVDFREELDQALNTNTYAVDRIMDFAAQRQIPVLHISTCYVNSFKRGLIDEVSHAPRGARLSGRANASGHGFRRFAIDAVMRELEGAIADTDRKHGEDPPARAEAMVALGQSKARRFGWNDCYTMTKWLAEQRLLARRPSGPLTILRPSIIESTLEQPFAGWLEGIKVADAVIYAYARRGLAMFPGRKGRVIDIIPADRVANSALLAAAELLSTKPGVRIYHCSSGSSNPLTIGRLREHVVRVAEERSEAFPRLFRSGPRRRLRILPPILFNALAGSTDALLRCIDWLAAPAGGSADRAPRFRKLRDLISLYAFYASPSYVFCNRRLNRLHGSFPAADRRRLPVDVAGIDWKSYISEVHIPGLHRYALKGDEPSRAGAPASAQTAAATAVD